MKTLQYINAHYNKDKSISLYCTDGPTTYKLKIIGFQPYFYVPYVDDIPFDIEPEDIVEIEDKMYMHEDGFAAKKIIVSAPEVVSKIRNKFTNHYEADIIFIRRFLIDTGICAGFMILNDNLNRPIHYTELKPIVSEETDVDQKSKFNIPLNRAYIDFEIGSTRRFPDPNNPTDPVTGFTMYCTYKKDYVTGILCPQMVPEGQTELLETIGDWNLIWFREEKDLLQFFADLLDREQPHLIEYWYGKIADREYPRKRALKFGIKINYHHCDEFDLCHGYASLRSKLYTFLKGVAVEEGIFKTEELVAEHYHKDIMEKDPRKFAYYNKLDVEIMVLLDYLGWWVDEVDKETLIPTGKKVFEPPINAGQFYWDLRGFVGLENCKSAMHNSVLIDVLHLRETHGKEVLNSGTSHSDEEQRKSSFEGAIVFEPMTGILPKEKDKVIGVLDMSRYYPNLFLCYNVDKLGCIIIRKLSALRDVYEKKMKETSLNSPEYTMWEGKRDKTKFLLNSVWAYYGCTWVRKYIKKKAELIAEKGRLGLTVVRDAICAKTPQLLSKLKEYVDPTLDRGFNVAFGDTDSTGVIAKVHQIPKLLWYLNEIVLVEHCKKENIPPLLKLAHEKTATKGIFVKSKTENKGVKKRRGMRIVWQKGRECDYIEIKGFDYVRGNCSTITRKMQMQIVSGILREHLEKIPPYINSILSDVRSGKYDFDDLAIPYTISRPLSEYGQPNKNGKKSGVPDFIVGARWISEHQHIEILPADKVKFLPCLRPTSKIAYIDKQDLPKGVIPDYDAIIEKTIVQKSLQFLKLADMTWRDVIGHTGAESGYGGYFT